MLGSLHTGKTPRHGNIHLSGSLGVDTGSYSRGAYDDDTKNLDDLVVSGILRASFALPDAGPLHKLSLTVASENNVTTKVYNHRDNQFNAWNDSNWGLGLGTEIGKGWRMGVTYEFYSNPSAGTSTRQVALAAAHAGTWGPSLKVEFPTDGAGNFFKAAIEPTWKVNPYADHPWTLKFPLALGVGTDDFYGQHTGDAGYLSFGIAAAMPLPLTSREYGNWSFDVSLTALARDKTLRQVAPPIASTDKVIPIGTVGVTFVY